MSTDALQQRLTLHASTAAHHCASLHGKTITPHVLRHTAAMNLLQAGVDITVIALWLGHESIGVRLSWSDHAACGMSPLR
jgi:site-specific recombinase XerD